MTAQDVFLDIQAKLQQSAITASTQVAMDAYTNKSGYMADISNLSTGVNVVKVSGVPVTSIDDFKSSSVDLTPVLNAISGLNDVTPAEVRLAFNEIDFKDKNTESEIHQWLDSYTNKDNWKADLSVVPTKYENADAVWSKVL